MRRALLSVTDKTGLVEFASGLDGLGFELLGTGGTAETMRRAGLPVTEVGELTGVREMLGGRVKTLHPAVHGGLLGDVRNPEHQAEMEAEGISPISVVAVNLYEFEKTVTNEHRFEEAIECIDIGGPAMLRSAAKNHANVLVVSDPEDYDRVLASLRSGSEDSLRLELAAKAFSHTAFYDSLVSRYLTGKAGIGPGKTLTLGWRRISDLRYGENPHQAATVWSDPLGLPGIAQARQLWGIPPSYNNYLDADAAWELVCDLPPIACAIIKHGNPCGAAIGADLGDAFRHARASDPISAFGGIAAFNGVVDLVAAEAMTEKGNFLEVVVGTDFTEEALATFRDRSGWGQNVRLLAAPAIGTGARPHLRTIGGGLLTQDLDSRQSAEWKVVTSRQPTEEENRALSLAWTLVRHIKSNAIAITDASRLLGVGAGQMNRVQSVRLAIEQAGKGCRGAALASDAFFPFPDSVETAAAAGITAIVQPGGSKKDPEVIEAANEHGIAMVFTGVRHFRH